MTVALVWGALLCVTGAAHADQIAFDTGIATGVPGVVGTTGGYQFTVTSAVTVDKLLLADVGPLGFNGVHIVNIYNDNGSATPITNLTAAFFGTAQGIYAGDAPFGAVWREFDVVDTVLAPGDYVIAMSLMTVSDIVGINVAPIVAANGVVYGEARSAVGTLVNPAGNVGGASNAYFGPNFTVLVPTPAAALMALPIFGTMVIARRRRRMAA